jgi:hypothetical protein
LEKDVGVVQTPAQSFFETVKVYVQNVEVFSQNHYLYRSPVPPLQLRPWLKGIPGYEPPKATHLGLVKLNCSFMAGINAFMSAIACSVVSHLRLGTDILL